MYEFNSKMLNRKDDECNQRRIEFIRAVEKRRLKTKLLQSNALNITIRKRYVLKWFDEKEGNSIDPKLKPKVDNFNKKHLFESKPTPEVNLFYFYANPIATMERFCRPAFICSSLQSDSS